MVRKSRGTPHHNSIDLSTIGERLRGEVVDFLDDGEVVLVHHCSKGSSCIP